MKQQQDNEKKTEHNINKMNEADNEIGDGGACTLSKALKVNTTLTTLYLGSVQQQEHDKQGAI